MKPKKTLKKSGTTAALSFSSTSLLHSSSRFSRCHVSSIFFFSSTFCFFSSVLVVLTARLTMRPDDGAIHRLSGVEELKDLRHEL
jgi:hypothetical protein